MILNKEQPDNLVIGYWDFFDPILRSGGAWNFKFFNC
jgi:hypothetical protein